MHYGQLDGLKACKRIVSFCKKIQETWTITCLRGRACGMGFLLAYIFPRRNFNTWLRHLQLRKTQTSFNRAWFVSLWRNVLDHIFLAKIWRKVPTQYLQRGGRNRIGRREKWPKKSWEEGEIGSESREKGDLLPCSSPLSKAGHTADSEKANKQTNSEAVALTKALDVMCKTEKKIIQSIKRKTSFYGNNKRIVFNLKIM